MAVSVFDLFKIGIGPSSSHTVGPMRAARLFVAAAGRTTASCRTRRACCSQLYGSLGATGKGHGSDKAVLLGLAGHEPDSVDVDAVPALLAQMRSEGRIQLLGHHAVAFNEKDDLKFFRRESLPFHANGLRFTAFDAAGERAGQPRLLLGGRRFCRQRRSGGRRRQAEGHRARHHGAAPPLPQRRRTAAALPRRCGGGSIAEVMRANERHWRSDAEIDAGLLKIWRVMQDCVERGCRTEGVLPGGFQVKRRAKPLRDALTANPEQALRDPLQVLDWVNLYALAVNEENAAGGRVVTAPTNGAAGIVPAVLHYYTRFVPGANDAGVIDFLLTAAAIGILYKENASISGAEVGCQGEVGVACSMAAGALCAVMGGTPEQAENAAEIGMEHHLGLTCDPVGAEWRKQTP